MRTVVVSVHTHTWTAVSQRPEGGFEGSVEESGVRGRDLVLKRPRREETGFGGNWVLVGRI